MVQLPVDVTTASNSVQVIHKVTDVGKIDELKAQHDGESSEQQQQQGQQQRQTQSHDGEPETGGDELEATSGAAKISPLHHARIMAYSVTDAVAFGLFWRCMHFLHLSTYRLSPEALNRSQIATGILHPPNPFVKPMIRVAGTIIAVAPFPNTWLGEWTATEFS